MIELILLGVAVVGIMCVAYISYRLDIKNAETNNTPDNETEIPPSAE